MARRRRAKELHEVRGVAAGQFAEQLGLCRPQHDPNDKTRQAILFLSRALTTSMRGPATVDAVTVADSLHFGRENQNHDEPFNKFGDDLTCSSASKAARRRSDRIGN
jgi:hypothetical protein